MSTSDAYFSKKSAISAVFAVSLGNMLEWYEIYLYVYWAPIIAKLFFKGNLLSNLSHVFLIFAIGFLARPFGGFVLGRIGDRMGRKKVLILSVLLMIVPTCIIGLLPSYDTIGIFAPIALGIMRFLQAFPAGAELPGGFCYLYESFPAASRRFMCSWGYLGSQLGIIISTAECLLLETFLSPEDLIRWGWRLSFLVGGLIGCAGFVMRYRLHETPLFQEMHSHTKTGRKSLAQIVQKHGKGIVQGILFCAVNSSACYLVTINFPIYVGKMLSLQYQDNLWITIAFLVMLTLALPLFGMLASRFSNKWLLLLSVWGMLLLLVPLYFSILYHAAIYMAVITVAFCFFVTCSSALIPYILPDLFPTHDRFTCTALSYNLSDSIIGGFTPVAAFYLVHFTQNSASSLWVMLLTATLSMIGYAYLKQKKVTSN